MLSRRDFLALQTMIAGGAFLGRPFDFMDVFGGVAKAAQIDWDSGALFHILPNVSHERALLKASFLSPLTETPEILVDGRRIIGQRNDTRGLYWQFDIAGLRAATEYELELRAGSGGALAEPWNLSTFPDPGSDIDHVRIAFYHCPGGHDVIAAANGSLRPTAVRRALIDKLAGERILYLANSMNALRIEGQKTVVIEICQQLNWQVPDWLVLPSGNLGNGYAMYAGFRMMKELGLVDRLPRLVLAQAANANPLYQAFRAGTKQVAAVTARATAASAIQIGNPVSAPRALKALSAMQGIVEQATEQQLADAAARADRTGLYICPHTAVALAAVEKLTAAGTISRKERVVVVSTANALKFTEFKVRYHENTLAEVDSSLANRPLELAADYGQVRDAIEAMGA